MVQWTYQRDNQSTSTEIQVDNSGNVYTADGDGNIISLDSSGTLRWTATDINGDGTDFREFAVTPDGSEVIVNYYSEIWYVLDGTDGSEITSYSDSYSIASGGMTTADNTRSVYVAEFGEPYLAEYDITTQTIVQTYTPTNGSFSAPSQDTIPYTTDSIFVGDSSGYIYDVARSDFTENDSFQVSSDGYNISSLEASSDGDNIIASVYDSDAGEGVFVHVDNSGAMTDTGTYTENGAYKVIYDSAEEKSIHPSQSQDSISKYITSGTESDRYTDASGDYENIVQNETFDDTLIYVNRDFGEIAQVSESEFTSVLEQVSASQVGAVATLNTTSAVFTEWIDAQQINATSTTNSADTLTIPRISATQVDAQANTNGTTLNEVTTGGTLTDESGTEYRIDTIEYTGRHPQFSRGQTVELTVGFNNTSVYDDIRYTFGDYLTEDTIIYDMSYDGITAVKQNINPLTNTTSYFFKFKPNPAIPSLDSWWVVMVGMENTTQMYGAGERLTVELLALEPDTGQTFSEITNKYEV